jgi:hypothetical protein
VGRCSRLHRYVDETQDNLLIDIFRESSSKYPGESKTLPEVLRLLCGNSDGLFWAGDTAQTISAGSSFRFNDLKAFLYRLQVRINYLVNMKIDLVT